MKVSIDVASLKVIEDNNKPGCSTNIVLTTNGNSGDATLHNNILNIPTVTLNGLGGITYSSLSATTPLSYNSDTATFSIQQASSTQSGYLSSSDWATFNGKQNALGYTPANKAGDTFTGNISAPNLSGTNTGDETNSSILSKIGFTPENVTNKATTLSSNDNTHYPTTAAVTTALGLKQNTTYTPSGTGAVDRTVSSKLQETISVKDFGAVGDGVADDTAAIQAALNVQNTYGFGYSVYLPPGSYKISSTLIIPRSGCHLIGDSNQNTKLIPTSTFSGSYVIQIGDLGNNYVFDSTVQKLYIYGYSAPTSLIGIYSQQAQEQTGVYRVIIDGLTGYGIHLKGTGTPSVNPAKFIVSDTQIWLKTGHSHSMVIENAYAIVREGSFVATSLSANSHGIHVTGASRLDCDTFHCERHDVAIYFDDATRGYAKQITFTNAVSSNSSAVELAHTSNLRPVLLHYIYAPGYIAVKDDYVGISTGNTLQVYSLGDYTVTPSEYHYQGSVFSSISPNVPSLVTRPRKYASGDSVQFQSKTDGSIGFGVDNLGVAQFRKASGWSDSAWNGVHAVMGNNHLWVDSTNLLRIKSSTPTSDTDGTVVGGVSALGYTPENVTNKATDLSSNDNVHYPTTAAVTTELALKQNTTYTPNGTGAVTRSVESKLKESISVKDFGAVGDGVTDDTAAIQAALNVSDSNGFGYSVYLPAGNYKVSSTLIIPRSGCHLIGDSEKNTRLTPISAFSGLYVIQIGDLGNNYIYDSTVQRLTIWGSSAPTGLVGIYSQQVQEQTGVYRVNIESLTGYGIHLKGTGTPSTNPSRFIVSDVRVLANSGHSHSMMIDTAYAIVRECSFIANVTATGSHGIHVTGASRLDCDTFHCERHDVAIYFDDATRGYAKQITFTNPGSTVVAVIQLAHTSNPRPVLIQYVYSSYVAVKDDYIGISTGTAIQSYSLGDYSGVPSEYHYQGAVFSAFAPSVPSLVTQPQKYATGDSVQFKSKTDGSIGFGVDNLGVAQFRKASGWSDSAWNGVHAVMGSYHMWVDSSGRLRIKSSAPTSDTDGTVVGTQS